MSAARQALQQPAAALLVRGHRYPLATASTAAGAGFVLGSLNVHPLRVPGVSSLLGGGLADAAAYAVRLIAELGLAGMVSGEPEAAREPAAHDRSEPA
ncbi:MAG: hypothetical protein WC617_18445 [Rhodanobacter sp.]|jgi:hypothetical protein